MQPMLDDLPLPQVQDITVQDVRALAEHHPPGRDGSLLQDLGRHPTRLLVHGVATGDDSLKVVERLAELLRAGTALPFVAEIASGANIAQVTVEDLRVNEVAGRPDRHEYLLTLVEHLEPAAPATAGPPGDFAGAAELVEDIAADAATLVGDLITGLGAAPALTASLDRFATGLGDLLERLIAFRKAIERANGR